MHLEHYLCLLVASCVSGASMQEEGFVLEGLSKKMYKGFCKDGGTMYLEHMVRVLVIAS